MWISYWKGFDVLGSVSCIRQTGMASNMFSYTYTVSVLKEGFRKEESDGLVHADGCCTLVLGPHNILVGTGSAQNKDAILKALQDHNVSADNIEYVVCTHAHPETMGNLNLFTNATHIVGYDISKHNRYIMHDFNEGIPYEIDADVEILPSPGLCHSAVTVMVNNSNLGTVAIAGSTFHCEGDLEDPDLWMDASLDPDTQQQSRVLILKHAQHIVPRYGKSFLVPDTYRTQLHVVMTP